MSIFVWLNLLESVSTFCLSKTLFESRAENISMFYERFAIIYKRYKLHFLFKCRNSGSFRGKLQKGQVIFPEHKCKLFKTIYYT